MQLRGDLKRDTREMGFEPLINAVLPHVYSSHSDKILDIMSGVEFDNAPQNQPACGDQCSLTVRGLTNLVNVLESDIRARKWRYSPRWI